MLNSYIRKLYSKVLITIRVIKRALRKWKLPVGTMVTCTSRYLEDTYKFEII